MKGKAPDRPPKQYDKLKMMILRLALGALIVAWIGVANYLGVGINARTKVEFPQALILIVPMILIFIVIAIKKFRGI